jgi:hypothetical protein
LEDRRLLALPANPAVVTCGVCNSLILSLFVGMSLFVSELRVPACEGTNQHLKGQLYIWTVQAFAPLFSLSTVFILYIVVFE